MYKNFIEDNEHIDTYKLCGNTELHNKIMSMFHKKNNIISELKSILIYSPDINKKNKSTGSTSMHYLLLLIKYKQQQFIDLTIYFELLLMFIELGGDMNIENDFKKKPLDIFHEIINTLDINGNTLLFYFVINKKYEIAKLLIKFVNNFNIEEILNYVIHNFKNDFNNIEHNHFINFLSKLSSYDKIIPINLIDFF
jgi:hypothetical protein